jgi:sugar phosphate isomerase/epimerase
MRFGLCTSELSILSKLGELGYDYADIGARALVPFEAGAAWAAAKRDLVATGASIEALSGFVPGDLKVVGPTVDRERLRSYLETTIFRAAEVGVKVINWGSAESRQVPAGWPMAKAWAQLEEAAGVIAEIAGRAEVMVVVEPVNPRETNILYYVTDAVNMVETINHPNLRVIADYFHCVKQNEPMEHIVGAAAYLVHTHTSDDARGFPCLGDWDQRPFLRTLRAAGYDGRMSFEVHRRPNQPYEEMARASVLAMRALNAMSL